MKNLKYSPTRFALFFAFIIMVLHTIPGYFHVKISIDYVEIQGKCDITKEASKITKMILRGEKIETIHTSLKPLYEILLVDQDGHTLIKEFATHPTYQELNINDVKGKTVWRKTTIQKDSKHTYTLYLKKELSYEGIVVEMLHLLLYNVVSLFIVLMILIVYLERYHKTLYQKLDNFFKDAIHEIGTPMGVLQLNLDMIEGVMPASKSIKRAQASLKTLISIYQSMEYSLKKDYVIYAVEDIHLSEYILSRLDFFQVFADLKELRFEINVEKGLHVKMNRVEVQRLIDNNFSNAIKYAKDKTDIQIILKQNDKSCLELTFMNEGAQITNPEKIFERYYRDFNFSVKGSGIGLNIVKQICDKYGIKIKVSSKEGKNKFVYSFQLS